MHPYERKWALGIFLFILLAYVLPYTVLSDTAKWYGSFLVWILLTAVVIVFNVFFTRDWGEKK